MATITGTSGSDTLNGTSGNDTLNGLGGNDALVGSGGTDFYDGGADFDTLDFRATATALVVDFGAGTVSGAFNGSFVNMERVQGGDGGDRLIGAAGAQNLSARAGSDTLAGAAGNDTLYGGTGADHFVFRETGAANADQLGDFTTGSDKIVLDASAMSALGAEGNFAAGDARFWSSASGTAHDADDRVIYNTTTRQVFYDADGNGSGAAVLIATLQTGATLVATDIAVEGDSSGGGQTINGTAGNDSLGGTDGDDTINGFGGDDTLNGGEGNDSLDGGEGNDTLDALTGQTSPRHAAVIDTLNGGLGDDSYWMWHGGAEIQDAGGIDTVHLNIDGEYTLPGGLENLTIVGSSNDNVGITGNDLNNVIIGGNIRQRIDGGAGNDTIHGGADNDLVNGGAGNDSLFGADGADSLSGGDGNDTLNAWFDERGDGFADALDGGLGDDVYLVTDDGDMIVADPGGLDTVHIFNGSWTLGEGLENLEMHRVGGTGIGNELDNVLNGIDAEGTSLFGMGGNDRLIGSTITGINRLEGGDGDDTLLGGDHADVILGDAGDDILDGGANEGGNTMTGGAGADRFIFADIPGDASVADAINDFATAADKLVFDGRAFTQIGASGNFAAGDARFWSSTSGTAHDADDRLIYNTSNGQLWYDADGNAAGAAQLIVVLQGGPVLAASDIEVINGTAPGGKVINGSATRDILIGTDGDDTINGLGGNDLIMAGSTGGNDVIDGGAGGDSIEFKGDATSAVVVDFVAGTITGGSSGSIRFSSIERVVGGIFNDSMSGSAAAQTLTGHMGSDSLWGAGGADTLWGGGGADSFVFREMGTANADRINDFGSGEDKVHLDDAAFSAIGAMGNFAVGDARFKANATGTATDANDRVIFDTSTGSLYYDADGDGSGTAQLIATVQSGASVAAMDIVVV